VLADTEVPKPTASVPDLKLVLAPDLSGLDPARAEHLKAAYQSLQAAIARKDLSPQELSEAYGTMAQLYHTYHLWDAAQICYENVGQLAPQNFAWRYARADILRQQGKVADALADYEAACRSQPKNIPCLIHQGRAHLDNHNAAKAGELFTRALALDPQAAAAHEGLGYVARAQERYQEAAQHFEAALALVPAANRLHGELAMLYQHLNDSEKAKAHLGRRGTVGIKVVDALTEQLEALVRGERIAIFRGRLAFYAGHYDEAATQFTKAVEADPRNATARVNLATMLVQIGESTTAITQLQEALRLQPALGGAHYNLAVLLLQQPQRLPDAIYHFRAALVADPTDRQLYVQLANALQRQGKGDEALIYAMKAADLDPTDEKVLLGTAALLVQRGYFAEARQRLEDAHQRFPKRGGTAHALAHLLATCPDPTLRDGKRALDLAQRVFAAQNSAPYAETVALAFAEVGQCNEAAKWQRALLTAAEKKGKTEITKRFKTDLARYENSNGGPCRPPVVTNPIPTEELNTVKK
jgi:tetratricopeptide (TPR) repeat protein